MNEKTLESYMDSLKGGPVRFEDKTPRDGVAPTSPPPPPQEETTPTVDSLFGESKAYREFQREKPEHRLMLWHRLRGASVKETAAALGYTPNAVREVCHQPWFREAFARLSTEIGKDVVETFLEGEVQNTLQVLVNLRDGAESEAVRKSACDSILDRVRGKPVATVKTSITGSIDTVVYDAAKLLEEEKRLSEALRSRGIGGTN